MADFAFMKTEKGYTAVNKDLLIRVEVRKCESGWVIYGDFSGGEMIRSIAYPDHETAKAEMESFLSLWQADSVQNGFHWGSCEV